MISSLEETTVIERATVFDKNDIYYLYAQYFPNKKEFYTTLNTRINNPEEVFLVAKEDSGKVIGFLESAIESSPNSFHINHLAVDDSYRGNGIGTKMIYALAQEAIFQNIESIITIPSRKSNAEDFYKSLGFTQQGLLQYIIDPKILLYNPN